MSLAKSKVIRTDKLHAPPLYAAGLAGRPFRIRFIPVLFGDLPIIPRVGEDEHSDSSSFLGS